MDRIDLSVIVPVYNLERFLPPLLGSLKAQQLDGYTVEYIFVLDSCEDDSEAVITNSGIKCTILHCSAQSCGVARNIGFNISRGNYIWFMDGDDWLTTDTAIKQALDRVKAEDLDILRIPFESNLFMYDYFSMVWQYVFRREYIKEFVFPAFQPCEDDAYMEMVLAKAGLSRHEHLWLPHLTKPLYHYNYLREGSNMYRVRVLKEKI